MLKILTSWTNSLFFLIYLACNYQVSFSQELPPKYEFRGLWITTAYNLDWPSNANLSKEEQQQEFLNILDKMDSMNMNAVIFQVRAAADAFYKSKHEPWSYWLTGKQGREPDYDPLSWMIEKCHERNIQLHAWFNLLRAVSHTKFFKPVRSHVSRKNKNWVYKSGNGLYFDPGIPEVRNYLIDVIMDVVNNYDIDGVHLDDYFYPQEINGAKILDQQTYRKYNNNLELEDWRRENVNDIVHRLSDSIKVAKKWCWFGISPVAVWRHDKDDKEGSTTIRAMSSYDDLYGDSKKWVEQGWVDYIMPQLYLGTGARDADIVEMANWWKLYHKNTYLFAGLAYYKTLTKPTGYWENVNEMSDQISIIRSRNFKGLGFFQCNSLMKGDYEVACRIRKYHFANRALVPPLFVKDSLAPNEVSNLKVVVSDSTQLKVLKWNYGQVAADGDLPHSFHIYHFTHADEVDFNNVSKILAVQTTNQYSLPNNLESGFLFVVAVDRNGNEKASDNCVFFRKK